jgi:hypothetical protein
MKLNQKKAQKSGSRYRLEAYLAAGLGSFGLGSSAEAGIVVIDLTKAGRDSENITGPNAGLNPGSTNRVYGFFMPGGSNSFEIYNSFFGRWGFDANDGLQFGLIPTANPRTATPMPFSAGAQIGSSTSTFWSETNVYTQFRANGAFSQAFGANTYMAMRSQIGSDNYYGWMEVTWNPTTNVFQILSAAYENTPNTMIKAGDTGAAPVPEPASSAVVALLMGGAALRNWRKNKNKQDAQEPSSESLAS